jgi:hypothetical protein
MGDIDLQHEIRVNHATGVVDCQRGRHHIRRIYSARLGGQSLSVAMYQGHGAEEVCYILLSQCCI